VSTGRSEVNHQARLNAAESDASVLAVNPTIRGKSCLPTQQPQPTMTNIPKVDEDILSTMAVPIKVDEESTMASTIKVDHEEPTTITATETTIQFVPSHQEDSAPTLTEDAASTPATDPKTALAARQSHRARSPRRRRPLFAPSPNFQTQRRPRKSKLQAPQS
jgi:hypothetical protein